MEWFQNMSEVMESLKRGAFLSAEHNGVRNTMTIGWGHAGIMWGKEYFIALVRPSRYTYDIIKDSGVFTVSVPDMDSLAEELNICGTKSGRDIDKSKVVNFLNGRSVKAPVVDGCKTYFECSVNYIHALDEDLMPPDIVKKSYGDNSFHTLFFGRIVDCYEK